MAAAWLRQNPAFFGCFRSAAGQWQYSSNAKGAEAGSVTSEGYEEEAWRWCRYGFRPLRLFTVDLCADPFCDRLLRAGLPHECRFDTYLHYQCYGGWDCVVVEECEDVVVREERRGVVELALSWASSRIGVQTIRGIMCKQLQI